MSQAESCINCEVGGRRPPRRFRARAPHLGVSVAQKALGAGVLPPPRPGCSAPPPSPTRPPAAPPTSWGREPDPAAGRPSRGEAGRGGTEPFLTPHRAAGPLAPPRCGPNAGGVRRWGGRASVGFGRFLIPRTYTRELSGPRSRATWPRGRSWASAPRATRWNSGGRHVARSNVQTRGAHGRPGADGAPRAHVEREPRRVWKQRQGVCHTTHARLRLTVRAAASGLSEHSAGRGSRPSARTG